MSVAFPDWMHGIQTRVESALAHRLPAAEAIPARLHQAMRYASLGGGKRIRPLLAFAAGELTQSPEERIEIASCAVELIHAYSLVHDDLPCMDDDVLRRGRPTCHVEYDEPTALLVGDSLQSLAFELLTREELGSAERRIEMVRLLAHASGSCGKYNECAALNSLSAPARVRLCWPAAAMARTAEDASDKAGRLMSSEYA